jgi:RNA polymerase sigma factor (sigma-70 family)
MDRTPPTRPSLLVRLRDRQDERAWFEFTEIYAPLIYRLARRRGLQDADAADLTQEVLRAVARAVESDAYDPARGSFRGWLFRIARNLVVNHPIVQARTPHSSGDTAVRELLEAHPAPDEPPTIPPTVRRCGALLRRGLRRTSHPGHEPANRSTLQRRLCRRPGWPRQGKNAAHQGAMQRLHWRRQALTWLCADLRAWQQVHAREPIRARAVVAQLMQLWLADPDMSGVRGAAVLARLPAEERAAWAKLWAGVADQLARTKDPTPRAKETPNRP